MTGEIEAGLLLVVDRKLHSCECRYAFPARVARSRTCSEEPKCGA